MIKKKKNPSSYNKSNLGFSIIELLAVVLILGIVTTFSLMMTVKSSSSFKLSNSATTMQTYLERAISDAKRRNAKGAERAKITVLSTGSYEVRIDADGDGSPENVIINLPDNIKFLYDPTSPPQATIDWRGNIDEGEVRFVLRSEYGETSEIVLSKKGDADIDGKPFVMPTVTNTPTSTDVDSSTVLIGNTSANESMSPTPTPTPLPYCENKQTPEASNCRCYEGKIIDDKGNCK